VTSARDAADQIIDRLLDGELGQGDDLSRPHADQ